VEAVARDDLAGQTLDVRGDLGVAVVLVEVLAVRDVRVGRVLARLGSSWSATRWASCWCSGSWWRSACPKGISVLGGVVVGVALGVVVSVVGVASASWSRSRTRWASGPSRRRQAPTAARAEL
jgi:hypothetical protein